MTRKAKVTRVVDGDTFRTASGRVRLANVYAPERGTKGGAKATQNLRDLVGGKTVTIDTLARDRYGREIANVKVGNKSVNKAVRDSTGSKGRRK